MKRMKSYHIILLFWITILSSCAASDQEPDVYDIDTYKIAFSGDIDAFHSLYTIYYTSAFSQLYDSTWHLVKDITSAKLPESETYYFRYRLDNKPKQIMFSCTALCLTDGEQKILEGSITREHNGQIIDQASFEIKSFLTSDRPNVEDYSFNIEI